MYLQNHYILLGGDKLEDKFNCYVFETCQWKSLPSSLNERRRFSTLTTLINSTNVLIGGEVDQGIQTNSIMFLKNKKWIQVDELHQSVSRHCAVQAKDDTIYIIGGHMESSSFSDETISFDAKNRRSATIAAKLNRGRQLHCCARLGEKHIIVVGGRDARGALKSVETLEARTSTKWIERKNLQLPSGISYAQLVSTNPSGYNCNNKINICFITIFCQTKRDKSLTVTTRKVVPLS
jgi:hypothetical protein